jgi:predicted DNA-binding transcriptional regulator AlpA
LLRLCGMRKKTTKVDSSGVIAAAELKIFVQLKMQMAGLSAPEYAEQMGVPRQTIYAILNGDRLPSKALLKKLGLETVYRIKPESGKK